MIPRSWIGPIPSGRSRSARRRVDTRGPEPAPETKAVVAAPDGDGDGVPDASDACPKQPGVSNADAEQNGCPQEADADGDGVPDASDACPKEPGVKSSDAKTSGCAAKVDAGKIKDKAEITFSGYQTLPGDRGVLFVELTDPVAVEVAASLGVALGCEFALGFAAPMQ